MHGIVRLFAGIVAAACITACAGNPQPGDPGYRYNVAGAYNASFTVEGVAYNGTMTLTTAPGGAVTGRTAVVSPIQFESQVAGTVVVDTLRMTIPYTMPDGCTGSASLRGPIQEGGDAASGAMDIQDSCGGALTGTFSLLR